MGPRRASGRRLVCATAGTLLLAGLLVTPTSATPMREWADGPVRYIMSDLEVRAWRSLKNDADRSVFIERFWSRRDPTPNTLVNEYREMFWQRVKEANERFVDSAKPGWKTDRGKIYILYGPPRDIEEDSNAATENLQGSTRGLIRWIYEGRPANDKSLDPTVVVPFVRDVSGEYRLSHDPRLASVFLDWDAMKDPTSGFWTGWLSNHAIPGGKTDLGVMLDQGTLQAIPSQEEYLLARVETFETYSTHPLDVAVARYQPAAAEGRTLAVVTISVPEPDFATVPALLARFVSTDATRGPKVLGEGSFHVEGSGPDRIAQARVQLDPGTWLLSVLAADPEGKSNGLYHATIDAPPADGRLRTSDMILARELQPVPYASLVSYDEAYVVGSFRVVPLRGHSLLRGQPFDLFYEIYGGRAPYRVTYRIEGKEDDGRWTALGKPAVLEGAQGAQGWTLPTGPRWPLGDYRVQIEIADAAGSTIASSFAFDLVAAPAP